MKWIVTGHSTKSDGLLYCVEAEDERAAVLKVAESMGLAFRSIQCDGETFYMIVQHDAYTNDEILNMIFEKDCRYFWEIFVQELKYDTQLNEAVCW